MGTSSFSKPVIQRSPGSQESEQHPQRKRRRSGIRRAFVVNFFAILTLATIATLICEAIVIYVGVTTYNTQFPPSQQSLIDNDKQYARSQVASLLARNPTILREWNTGVQQVQGMHYVIVDSNDHVVAGSASYFSPLPSTQQLAKQNAPAITNGQQRDIIPLTQGQRVRGYLLLSYPAQGYISSQRYWIAVFLLVFFAIVVLTPFVFLFLAALLFAWRTGRKISRPVNELMGAIEKIQHHDLNFHIEYDKPDELGDLCQAFNELRTELQQSLEREWQQQEEMREMIAALSHDLRTPVTIIQGHIEGLARAGDKRGERLDRYLPVLESSSQRMSKLLNDMLLVASLEQVGFLIHPQPTDLDKELTRLAHVYTLRSQERNIQFVYSAQPSYEDEQPVMLDMHRIEQVLDNLFENALRHTPERGCIFFDYKKCNSSVVLTMRDTGSGISPQDLPHIFEKFYQGQQHKQQGHSGLGLYICKQLVEQHGGSIVVKNCDGGGCEMMIQLPYL